MSFIRERPVMFWNSLTGIAEAVIGSLLIFDLIDWTADQVGMVMVLIAAVGTMFSFLLQGIVTPTYNPKDDSGNPLTPGPIGSEESEDLPPV
jgi:uncharacterized membrane protein YkgB